MPQNHDIASTLAGGAAGLGILATVRWENVPNGECVKIGVALLLIVMGYFGYRKCPQKPPEEKP